MPCSSKIIPVLLVLSVVGNNWSNPLSLLQKNQYLEAIKAWEPDAERKKLSQKKLRALKGQAIAYYKLGRLYQKLHEFSIALEEAYYNAIAKHTPTPTLRLYQGQVQFYKGNFKKAVKNFEKVIISRKASARDKDMAKVYRHYAMNKLRGKNLKLILNSMYPDVKWQMLNLANIPTNPNNFTDKDSRSIRNKLDLLLKQKDIEEKKIKNYLNKILQSADAEIILNKGKLTQINFYDPVLLKTISNTFFHMSKFKYEQLDKSEGRYPTLASKFNTDFSLAEVYYELGFLDKAEKFVKTNSSKKGYILRAKIKAKKNQKTNAKELLNALTAKDNSPATKRDAGYAFHELGLSTQKALFLATHALQKKKSSLYYQRYASILFGYGKQEEALEAYAKGYKIQFRNNIEQIDPEYMIEYAYAIFRASKMRYDEVVETLYHLQKAYPVCRRLHYCMQGIAAAETRTFQSEKIFRKGG